MDWGELRAVTRGIVHGVFAVPATYIPATGPSLPITVRMHTRSVRLGDLDREGYAEVIEDISRVVLFQAELDAQSIVTSRGRRVKITRTGWEFMLDNRIRQDDETLQVWDVVAVK